MGSSRFVSCWLVCCTVVFPLIGQAADAPAVDPTSQLTLQATVLLPNGEPAVGATVTNGSHSNLGFQPITAKADDEGNIEITDQFRSGLRLHARTPNGSHQAVLMIPDSAVRTYLAKPFTIQLKTAVPHRVVVTAKGDPVHGAKVHVGSGFQCAGITGSDGTATIWIPAGEKIREVVVWHPKLGVNGVRSEDDAPIGDSTELSLLSPKPHLVRLVDRDGRPVTNQKIRANVRPADGSWIVSRAIEAAESTTDEKGEAWFEWFPASDLKYVEVEIVGRQWKKDETDQEQISDRKTTVHVRRRHMVQGRVVVPGDADASGLFLQGFGFGNGGTGEIPRTRTGDNGLFQLDVPAGHGFVMGVVDTQWASDAWSGALLPVEDQPQADIELKAYPATPVEVQVTRGDDQQPVANAFVHYSQRGRVEWTDETGESRSGQRRRRRLVVDR